MYIYIYAYIHEFSLFIMNNIHPNLRTQSLLFVGWSWPRLCATPVLLPTLMDGLVWRSRQTRQGVRRVNYYVSLGEENLGPWTGPSIE